MLQEQYILLQMVRSALWGTPVPDIPEDLDWSTVIRLAKEQTVAGLLADSIGRLPQDIVPDYQCIRQLHLYIAQNIRAHSLMNAKIAETDRVLRAGGILPVLLKGQGIALNYPDPLLRQCGDIDLYIGKENYSKAIGLLQDAYGSDADNSENMKHFHLDSDGLSIELHRVADNIPGFFRNRRFYRWTSANLRKPHVRNVSVGGNVVAVPPVQYDVIYILNHAWHHFLNGGVGLRQICDWTMLLHRHPDSIDAVQLEKDLKSFGLLKVWQIFSWIAVNILGLPASECPLYTDKYARSAEMMFGFIMKEGNFGYHGNPDRGPRPKGYASGKLYTFRNVFGRHFRIFRIYPAKVLQISFHYIRNGIYEYFKGLK